MKRILLVEDEQALARHLTRLLQAEGFTVVHAATQRAAVACLEETPLDLALVDISLPDGNGFAVCTAIKRPRRSPCSSSPPRQTRTASSLAVPGGR